MFARGRQIALKLLALVDQDLDALNHIVGPRFQDGGGVLQAVFGTGEIGARAIGGQRFDAAHAARTGALAENLYEPNIARAFGMCAAAQLDRPSLVGFSARAGTIWVRTHRYDAHFIAILFAEQRHGAGCLGLIDGHQPRFNG